MATLQRKKIYNKWYWYIVECKRINGKPRPIILKYIGTNEKLIKMLMKTDTPGKVRVKSFTYGSVYALLKVAEDMGLEEIFEKYFSKQQRDGLNVSKTLLLCSIYRACKPGSKRAFSEWVSKTSLPTLLGFNSKQLTSQHFWDQMDSVKEEEMEKVEEEITKRLINKFGISLDVLLYDVTNFYTYIATNNKKNKICQRGRNKQKRNDLRQFNLALLVSREFFVPILKEVYEGNITDVSSFPSILSKIRKRLEVLTQDIEDITFVFDKGNYSKTIQKELEGAMVHWVGSLSVSLSDDFTEIKKANFYPIKLGSGKEVIAHRMKKNLWGKDVTIVITFSEKLRVGQIRGFKGRFTKAINFLKEIDGSSRSVKKAKADMAKILSRDHIGEVITPEIKKRRGKIKVGWAINVERYRGLINEYFGRKVLFTTRGEWSDREIIEAYNGLGRIENVFKYLKNPFHLSMIPEFHWTDHKIKVHAFYCLIGLILTGLLYKKVKQKGIDIPPVKLLDKLENVREVLIIEDTGSKGRPRARRQMEEMDKETKKLFETINI
jgi:transposase